MTVPAKKSPALETMLNKFTSTTFGRERTDSISKDVCVTCGKEATNFKDQLSRKEYTISGMCQTCQDSVFGEDDD
mgnify:CR=1 FL=1